MPKNAPGKGSCFTNPLGAGDGIGTMLPVMRSDITLTGGDEVLIIDAKYYGRFYDGL